MVVVVVKTAFMVINIINYVHMLNTGGGGGKNWVCVRFPEAGEKNPDNSSHPWSISTLQGVPQRKIHIYHTPYHTYVYTQPLFSSIHNIAIIMWPPTCMHIDFMLNNLSPLSFFPNTKPHQKLSHFLLGRFLCPFFLSSIVVLCVCTVHSLCFFQQGYYYYCRGVRERERRVHSNKLQSTDSFHSMPL